jgi:hypothetical protein
MIRRMEESQRDRDKLLKQAQEVRKFDDTALSMFLFL